MSASLFGDLNTVVSVGNLNTIAALQGVNSLITPGANVLGYWTPADGGGGYFVNGGQGSSALANGGTIIATLDGYLFYRVLPTADLYAKYFGAKYDGVTDDWAAHQNMYTSVTNPKQQICRGHPGATVISKALTIPDGVSAFFDSKGSTTIIYTGGITGSGTEYSLFKIGNYVNLGDCQVKYPNQIVTGTPLAYPATITGLYSGGCSYSKIRNVRFNGAYIGFTFGNPATGLVGCGNIDISGCDGQPLYRCFIIDGCNDILRISDNTFNVNLFGAGYYAASTLLWIAQNCVVHDFYAVDAAKIDKSLTYGVFSSLQVQANPLGKTCQFLSVTEPTWELNGKPLNLVNFQNQCIVVGGTITGQHGEAAVGGANGLPSNLGSGDTTYYCQVKFIGTTFRSFYEDCFIYKTNVQFINCDFYDYQNHNVAAKGAITAGANGCTVSLTNCSFNGLARAFTRGIDCNGFTGCRIIVNGLTFLGLGATCMNIATGNTLVAGPCLGTELTGIFYNGLTCTINNQGQLCTNVQPAAGTHVVSEIFYSNAVPAAAAATGWGCSVAGTPGTWVKIGVYS